VGSRVIHVILILKTHPSGEANIGAGNKMLCKSGHVPGKISVGFSRVQTIVL